MRRRGLEQVNSTTRRRRRAAVTARDGERCQHCGTGDKLTLDHRVPYAKGGSNRIDNLQLLCWSCNQRKADIEPVSGQLLHVHQLQLQPLR